MPTADLPAQLATHSSALATAPTAPATVPNPSTMQAQAVSMVSTATGFINSLATAGYITPPVIDFKGVDIATAPKPVTDTMPTLTNVAWVQPTAPTDFTGTVPDVSGYIPGPFTGVAPMLSFGTAPIPDYGSSPDAPGINLNFTFPSLELTLPAVPSLMSISVLPFDGVTLPTLDATVPNLTAFAPNILGYNEKAIYVSTLLTSLEGDLNSAITTGEGLVVGGDVENAIWDRGREREYRQQADALLELDRMEELGYAFPPGVYLDARLKVTTETANSIAGVSREIMIKQAETMLENLKQARTVAVELEGKQLDYANQVAQRAFECAKFVAEASIQVYNAEVEAFKASLDGFRTKAQIYETLIKGAQTEVEIYKATLDAEKIKAEINTTLVQQYEVQIKAQTLFVDVYKAELGAIETQANLQKIVVEAYGEEIKAYVGKVNAFSAQVEAYKTQLQSQEVISGIFKTQVDAYGATVHAGAEEATAMISGYKANIDGYVAKLDGYKAQVSAMSEHIKGAAAYNTSVADVYRSEMTALASYNSVLTEQWKAAADLSEKQAEVAVKAAEANGQLAIAAKNVVVEALKGGASAAAQIGAAGLNAVHWSQSASWSSSISNSIADSYSTSVSAADSYSETASA